MTMSRIPEAHGDRLSLYCGTTPALGAVVHARVDALAEVGVEPVRGPNETSRSAR
jgi:hypothetical protein